MFIKKKEDRFSFRKFFVNELCKIVKTKKRIGKIVLLIFWSITMITVGIIAHRQGYIGLLIKPIITTNYRLPLNYIQGFFSNPERISIDINYKNYQKLAYKREIALAKGILIKDQDSFVSAEINWRNRVYPVKIRLKGDEPSHYGGDKWSFRVIVRGDNAILGMKEFSIQDPMTRAYLYEWLFHKLLRREGLLAIRYDFIDVTINGKHKGVYALEEHFRKHLVEHNQRREGPIVRFDESFLWVSRSSSQADDYYSGVVDVFQTSKTTKTPELLSQFNNAKNLMEAFRRGVLQTHRVFDNKQLAKYMAICDLMGASHATRWKNIKFYYNPVTSLLEPIGYDAYGGGIDFNVSAINALIFEIPSIYFLPEYQNTVFEDPVFFRHYVKELRRVSSQTYLDSLFYELSDEIASKIRIIHKDEPYYNFDKSILYQNQRFIRDALNPYRYLNAYFKSYNSNENTIILEIGNIQPMPIELLSVQSGDLEVNFPKDQNNILSGKKRTKPVEYLDKGVILPEGFIWSDELKTDLIVNCRILGAENLKTEKIYPWTYLDFGWLRKDIMRKNPNYKQFDFLQIDEEKKSITCKPGKWQIEKTLIIPSGYVFYCGGNTKLDLTNSAMIVSFSPLVWLGTQEDPIIIGSSDSTGQGLFVLKNKEKTYLSNVVFKNLRSASKYNWELTGAVTFYESPVEISRCRFIENRSEDGLNIIRSDFKIDNCLFKGNFSDAFDIDFSEGNILHSNFYNCGNDAIDISGSIVIMDDIYIEGASDKGLSVGERSKVSVRNIKIYDSNIALASKDLSELEIDELIINNCKIGFTVYQKKPEFGPATITVSEHQFENVATKRLIENESTLMIGGKVIKGDKVNVFQMLYGT